MDEEGNQGYYLYNESTGEEKLFSIVEEERKFARGTKEAGKKAMEFLSKKGNKGVKKINYNRMSSFLAPSEYKSSINSSIYSKIPRDTYINKLIMENRLRHKLEDQDPIFLRIKNNLKK